MIKLAILFQEDEMDQMDLSHPERGNPGVGGTAFCFLLLMKFLEKYQDKIQMTVYQLKDNILPIKQVKKVSSLAEMIQMAVEDGNEIALLRNHQTKEAYELLQNYSMKYIFWMHNKLTIEEIRLFDRWDDVKRVISVGREMYDYYIDDVVSRKLDYISNMYVSPPEEMIRKDDYPNYVTYTGSLTYDKNFHLLANVWKEIIQEVPDAELHVIGSGRLYDKNSIMGTYGIAEKEYEDLFMPGLCDEDGKILPSVIFHGIMGEEKNEIYRLSAVGVVNPMATETFCLSAIEKEACGMPIVTRRKNGLLDTVRDGETGILYKDIKDLPGTIIELLKNRDKNISMSRKAVEFARTKFRPEIIVLEWVRVLEEVQENVPAKYHRPKKNMDNNGKWIRMCMHAIHACPLFRFIPSIHDIQRK